nr:PREDICTED: protein FAR1-RELATED SEQUENCE 1-like [Daucus carota subsp. sativus]
MSNNKAEASAQGVSHIESSDSEHLYRDSDSETSESDEDVEEEINIDVEREYPKVSAPKHFPTLEDAFLFYREYGRQGGFDVRKSGQKSDRRGNVVSKVMQCNCGGNPTPGKLKSKDDMVVESSQDRRTTSRRCLCEARIVLKAAGQRGFVVMSFVEEHNHHLAVGAESMFLRCNRNVSKSHLNFIMDCSRGKIDATRAYNLAKEMVGSYENVGATCSDFKNFARDVNLGIGEHNACMIRQVQNENEIGPKRATDKVFMGKLKSVIYSENSSPIQFEEGWAAVISEYELQDNKWLADMFRKRISWIPAYFYDIEMAGLLRTTSRSESSYSFFQHFHERGDTLVEFFSSFESAMDKQRLRTIEDDRNSGKTPRMETPLHIEKYAAQVYTLALYYRVREEIRNACFHTTMPEMSRTDEMRYFTCKDDLAKGQLFKHCGIQSIPRKYVKARWTKDALKNHSSLGSIETPPNCDKAERIKHKRTRACFEFQHCLDMAGEDEDKIDMVRSNLRDLDSTFQKGLEDADVQSQANRVDAFIGPIPVKEE